MKWFRFLFLAVAVALPPPAPASAQTAIAFMGGANRSWWAYEDVVVDGPDVTPVARMSVGVTASIPLRKWFAVQFGSAYSRKGGLEISAWGGWRHRRELDYLEMTLLGRLGYPLTDLPFDGYLLAGLFAAPQVSCRVWSEWRRDMTDEDPWQDCVSTGDGRWDGGWVAGTGLDVRLNELNERLGVTVSFLFNRSFESLSQVPADRMRTLTLRGGLIYYMR